MKVHPIPTGNDIIFQLNPNRRSPLFEARKKLKRLPHVFSRVLELPFRSDADVSVEEGPDFFRFVAETDEICDEVRAHTIEIHPGVMKIVIRNSGSMELTLDELELDMWRFRLPERTRPELATAVFVAGELIVTVPKAEELEDSGDGDVWGDETGRFRRLVLVQ